MRALAKGTVASRSFDGRGSRTGAGPSRRFRRRSGGAAEIGMRSWNTDELAAELAGLMLYAVLAGVPLESLDHHLRAASDPGLRAGSPRYAALLRVAIADLRDAAEECGYPAEVVRAWGPVPVRVVLAIGKGLLDGRIGRLMDDWA